MKYDKEQIDSEFSKFWRENKNLMKYNYRGNTVTPESVSSFSLQLREGDYGEGYNFHCDALNMRVKINNHEKPYNAEFVIKVGIADDTKNQNGKPLETVLGIKNNTIFLKD